MESQLVSLNEQLSEQQMLNKDLQEERDHLHQLTIQLQEDLEHLKQENNLLQIRNEDLTHQRILDENSSESRSEEHSNLLKLAMEQSESIISRLQVDLNERTRELSVRKWF